MKLKKNQNESNMPNKKCIIYYGINEEKNNKNKIKKLEIPFKEIISNKNFLATALIKKESLENLYKLILIDCNISNIEILTKTPFENLTELNLRKNGLLPNFIVLPLLGNYDNLKIFFYL